MTKKIAFAVLFLFNASLTGFSQELRYNIIYVRAGVSELSAGYERKFYDNIGVGMEVGYRFRYTEEAYVPYGIIGYPFQAFWLARAFRGWAVRPLILNYYSETGNLFSISTSYQNIAADNIIYDPGKFGGSNTSSYAEYSEKRHQFGLSFFYHQPFRSIPRLNWFLEVGGRYSLFERHYTVEGTYTGQYPSDKVTNSFNVGMISKFGLKVNAFDFN